MKLDKLTAEAVVIAIQKVKILWAQKFNGGRPAGGRPTAPYTIYFCCGEKGHCAKDCTRPQSECNFCKRTGHVGSVCRQKKAVVADSPPPSVFFFDGYLCVAELQSDSDSFPVFDFSNSDYVCGEFMVGVLGIFLSASSTIEASTKQPASTNKEAEAAASPTSPQQEAYPSASSTNKESAPASTITSEDNQYNYIMAATSIVTSSTDFLGDTGASHHIAYPTPHSNKSSPL